MARLTRDTHMSGSKNIKVSSILSLGLLIPTFVVEDALHLHAASGVGNAQGAAGDQAFCCRGTVSGAHKTPVRLVVWPLQNLHRLATPDGQLITIAGREVVNHHRQLTATRELGRDRGRGTDQQHKLRILHGQGHELS